MFVAQAHSFTQQARLAITLAWVAGYTNILTILICGHVTSHVSGTTSELGSKIVAGIRGVSGSWMIAGALGYILACFVAGAAISAILTEFGKRRGWESIYVLPMAVQSLLLCAMALIIEFVDPTRLVAGLPWLSVVGLASSAMGLQNATITKISSGVVRTTHVTGVLTDLGTELVNLFWGVADRREHWMHHNRRTQASQLAGFAPARRVALLASIMGSFALGAALGTLAHEFMPRLAMLPPVIFLLWLVYLDASSPIAEIEPSDLVADWNLTLPSQVAVFHVTRDKRRQGPIHRFPNLLAWIDRLPATTRVVVLDLDHITQLDHDAAFELRAALLMFRHQGRTLLLAGLTDDQVHQLRDAGVGELLSPSVVCPDVELAVARALVLSQK